MNEWYVYIVRYCVLLYTQSALQSCVCVCVGGVGGLSSTTTILQHPVGWCDGCHSTTAPVRSPHTSHLLYLSLIYQMNTNSMSKSSKLNNLSSYKTRMGCPKFTLQKLHKVNMTVTHTTPVNESIFKTWPACSLCVVSEVIMSLCIIRTKSLCLCSSEERKS